MGSLVLVGSSALFFGDALTFNQERSGEFRAPEGETCGEILREKWYQIAVVNSSECVRIVSLILYYIYKEVGKNWGNPREHGNVESGTKHESGAW